MRKVETLLTKQILSWTGYLGRWVGKVAFSLKREAREEPWREKGQWEEGIPSRWTSKDISWSAKGGAQRVWTKNWEEISVVERRVKGNKVGKAGEGDRTWITWINLTAGLWKVDPNQCPDGLAFKYWLS